MQVPKAGTVPALVLGELKQRDADVDRLAVGEAATGRVLALSQAVDAFLLRQVLQGMTSCNHRVTPSRGPRLPSHQRQLVESEGGRFCVVLTASALVSGSI